MKENLVISMGGSLIFSDKIDIEFYKEIRKIINKHIKNYNMAIVCGGGKTAREYSRVAKELFYLMRYKIYWELMRLE